MAEQSILMTGASGFIGSALQRHLKAREQNVRTLAWRAGAMDFSAQLASTNTVIHLAGLAHAGSGRYQRDDYLRVNTEYPVALAQQAISAGVTRFIFVSSVKAAAYDASCSFNDERCEQMPDSNYGYSKYLAEQQLQALDWQQCRLTIVRPGLVVGPDVKGNMALLQRFAGRAYFPAITGGEARSLLMLPDLLEFLSMVTQRSQTPSSCYIVTSECLSLGDQVATIRRAQGQAMPLWRVSAGFLRAVLGSIDNLTARRWLLADMAAKMLDRECYSAQRAAHELDWQAKYTLEDML